MWPEGAAMTTRILIVEDNRAIAENVELVLAREGMACMHVALAGKVLFDSRGQDVGRDYSRWLDVSRTLNGQYGARTTRDDNDCP
jgi:CheY-like chemotaxis protein